MSSRTIILIKIITISLYDNDVFIEQRSLSNNIKRYIEEL